MGCDLQVEKTASYHECGKLGYEGGGKSTEPRGWVFAYFWQVCRTLFFSCPSSPKSFPLPPSPSQLTSPREAHGTCPKQFKKPKGKDSPGRLISLVFLSVSWDGAETGPNKLFLARFISEVTGRGTLGHPGFSLRNP